MSGSEQAPEDRTTAADRVPIADQLPPRDEIRQISLHRRQSRTIAAPRKWRKHGLNEIVCPECRALVASIPDGFWHLQTAHNQGKGVDLETWGQELRAELDEFMASSAGRRGYVDDDPGGKGVENLAAGLVAVMALMALIGVIFMFTRG